MITIGPHAVDIEQQVNDRVASLLSLIRAILPEYLVVSGLDPWKEVASRKDMLGKINLGICTAGVEAKHTVKKMTGLHAFRLDALHLASFDGSHLPTVTGTLNVTTKLDADLCATVCGRLLAACGVIGERARLFGKITARGVTGAGTARFTATVAPGSSRLDALVLAGLDLDYAAIEVELGGLGLFDAFREPLVALLRARFGDLIKTEVAGALGPFVNDLFRTVLPRRRPTRARKGAARRLPMSVV